MNYYENASLHQALADKPHMLSPHHLTLPFFLGRGPPDIDKIGGRRPDLRIIWKYLKKVELK